MFQEGVKSKCKSSEAEKRLTGERKRKENSVLCMAREVSAEVEETSEESLRDLIRPIYSENHTSHRGLLSRLVTRPNGGFKILQLHLVTAFGGIGIKAGN